MYTLNSQIEWTHNGTVISTNKTLRIDHINTSHKGQYICTAKNEYGTENITFNLSVLSEFT